MLKAIEWRWNLAPLTPRDAAARNLAEVLDFTNAPDLTAPRWNVPPAVGLPCGLAAPDYEQWRSLKTLANSLGWSL